MINLAIQQATQLYFCGLQLNCVKKFYVLTIVTSAQILS